MVFSRGLQSGLIISLRVVFHSYLLGSFPSFHRADRQAESGRAREVRQVDVIGEPLIPPGQTVDVPVLTVFKHE